MLPLIALVGRANVGKSTLFNCLTRSRDALVADQPGLTRDRKYGVGRVGARSYLVVDTGGLGGERADIAGLMAEQALVAVREADLALLVVDARDGLVSEDEVVAAELRRCGKPVQVVVNKAEGLERALAGADFHALGFGAPHVISAAHGRGVVSMMDAVMDALPPATEEPTAEGGAATAIRVAVIGRPNVGKSTLINRLLGEPRLLTNDQPGTTRDSIEVPFERDARQYTLVDTAGVRRRSRVRDTVEKFSIVKALQAIEAAHVVVMVFDAQEGITEQDASLLGLVLDSGRALVLAVNKWDGLAGEQRETVRRELEVRLGFVDFAEVHFISALHGTAVGTLLEAVPRAYDSATARLATPELTRILEQAVHAHPPPLVHGRRIKLRYAHQGGQVPPLVIVHGNQTSHVPAAYTRYLSSTFRKAFHLTGTPLRVEYRSGANPYHERGSRSGPRRAAKRRRTP